VEVAIDLAVMPRHDRVEADVLHRLMKPQSRAGVKALSRAGSEVLPDYHRARFRCRRDTLSTLVGGLLAFVFLSLT
jgi:hypothetical protein